MWKLKIAEGSGPWLTTTNNHVGRQHWEFDPDAGTPEERAEVERLRQEFKKNRSKIKQSADRLMRMQLRKEKSQREIPEAVKINEGEEIGIEAVTATLTRAISFYSSIQAHDGHWPAENSGLLYFLPPLVMALYVTGALNTVLSPQHKQEIIRYIYNHQNDDGGWGLHIEGPSIMFGSALSYICLRLLGESEEDGEDMAMAKGRKWILDHGGLVGIPSWGKFWVSVIGLYEWSGCNPMPPEFWLLPQSFPIHPGNMLCYCRLIYMPMSYLYGKRFVGPITPLIQSLRYELYNEPYHQVNWSKARNTIAEEDLFQTHPLIQDLTWGFLYNFAEPILTRWPFVKLREKALKAAIQLVRYEDENSRYICVGCVEKSICLLACWVEDPNGDPYKRHLARLPDYYWLAEDGLKMQSVGSQTWDTCFAIQAIMSTNMCHEFGPTLLKAHDFLKASQIRQNPSGNFKAMYRHKSKGAWAFAIPDHGLPVSDCTAEGLKCALLFSQMPPELVGDKMKTECLHDAVNVILYLQSGNGGFAAWEPQRAYRWLEKFNPIENFEDSLIEKEHVECTSSAIQALAMFRKSHPKHRKEEIDAAIAKAVQYIEATQNLDGSWYGWWAICYTYGTWFGVGALVACGRNYHNSSALRRACEFLLSKQLPCGGWGESHLSCQNKAEIDPAPIHRGIRILINAQMDDGDFPQEEVTGAFFRYNILNFGSYRNIFPIWALGEYQRRVVLA